jgi:hypothetical protein
MSLDPEPEDISLKKLETDRGRRGSEGRYCRTREGHV